MSFLSPAGGEGIVFLDRHLVKISSVGADRTMIRVVHRLRLSFEMRTITALTLPLCVTLTITDVQAGVQSGGKSNQAQSESVVDYDVPGSVRHTRNRGYEAAQRHQELTVAQQRRESQGAQERRASQGAQERRASEGAQERRASQGAQERRETQGARARRESQEASERRTGRASDR